MKSNIKTSELTLRSPNDIVNDWARLAREGRTEDAIDAVYELNLFFDSGNFNFINQMIRETRLLCEIPEALSICISMITVGKWAEEELRDELLQLYDLTYAALIKKHDKEYAINCLKGLEIK